MDKLKTVQANSSLPLPQPTLSVAGFRSDNGMCFNQFALFTIFESIIYRVYGMICHLPTGDRSSTSLNLLLTNFRVNRSKTEIVSQKTKLLLGSKSLTAAVSIFELDKVKSGRKLGKLEAKVSLVLPSCSSDPKTKSQI